MWGWEGAVIIMYWSWGDKIGRIKKCLDTKYTCQTAVQILKILLKNPVPSVSSGHTEMGEEGKRGFIKNRSVFVDHNKMTRRQQEDTLHAI